MRRYDSREDIKTRFSCNLYSEVGMLLIIGQKITNALINKRKNERIIAISGVSK